MATTDKSKVENSRIVSRVDGDAVFFALIVVDGFVSSVLSFLGAKQMFDSVLVAVAFAVVVHGTIVSALWALPSRTLLQKAMLMVVWSVAVTFSVGAAYLGADHGNDGTRGRKATSELVEYIGAVRAKLNALDAEAAQKMTDAEGENSYGAQSGVSGQGKKYRELRSEAERAATKAKVMRQSAEPALVSAETQIKAMEAKGSVEEGQRVFDELKGAVIGLAEGIPDPSFMNQEDGPFDRFVLAVNSLKEGDDGARARTLYTIFVASLMEAVAFLLALIRIVMHSTPDHRSPSARVAAWVAKGAELRHVPEYMGKLVAVSKQRQERYLEDMEQKGARSEKGSQEESIEVARTKRRASVSESSADEVLWRDAINMQADMSKLSQNGILHELIRENGSDPKALRQYPAVRQAAILTGVLVEGANGLKRGQRHGTFIRFVFAEHARLKKEDKKAITGNRTEEGIVRTIRS